LEDEPLSHIPETVEGEYKHHFHNYTLDDPRDYKIVARWRRILDRWAHFHNEEEKVYNDYNILHYFETLFNI
jgi:hypothetical protein